MMPTRADGVIAVADRRMYATRANRKRLGAGWTSRRLPRVAVPPTALRHRPPAAASRSAGMIARRTPMTNVFDDFAAVAAPHSRICQPSRSATGPASIP